MNKMVPYVPLQLENAHNPLVPVSAMLHLSRTVCRIGNLYTHNIPVSDN